MRIRAAVLHEPGRPVVVEEVELAAPRAAGARLAGAGLIVAVDREPGVEEALERLRRGARTILTIDPALAGYAP